MSPNTVSQSLARLRDAGILDFQRVGPSHAVRLRDDVVVSATLRETFDAESALLDKMKRAVSDAVPEGSACYLFGSTARGDADPDSDVDLLVVSPAQEQADEVARQVYRAARHVVPARVRVLALGAKEFRRDRNLAVYQNVVNEGQSLTATRLEAFL